MFRFFSSRQFMLFLISGGIAASVNFSSRILYSLWLDFSAAVILAYMTGMVVAFILFKVYVFKSSQLSTRNSSFFVLVNLVAVIQTWVISMVLAYYLLPSIGITRYIREISHAVGIIVPVFTSYIGHKRWSFR